jgi:integrase
MAMTEPVRDKEKIKELINYYRSRGQIRNYALIVMGIHTALRISDLLRLRWEDVYDFDRKKIRKTLSIVEKKTNRSKTIALNKNIVRALSLYTICKTLARGEYIFASQKDKSKPISRIQAYRIVRAAANELRLRTSCHSPQ